MGTGDMHNKKAPTSITISEKTKSHPCFSAGACQNARIHIPVAPACNISCNYCNRKFDCVNESRPGVTSEILTPEEAAEKFITVREKINNLKVIGIAGPGDALANFDNTKNQ
jgi:MoaA/NifB/PqqE/SkfB family radical SAM enzyme